MNIFEALFLMMFLHCLGDFALQSDAMAKGKNRHRKPDYIPKGQKYKKTWPYWLLSHAFIQGGLIYIFTGNLMISLNEFLLHFVIDFIKCENITNPHHDQALHFFCRITYSIILVL